MNSEYVNNWHRIWSNRKRQQAPEGDLLSQLILLDGFDSPLGLMSAEDWKNYVALFATRSEIVETDSIFEVGCGGGAFLYPFYQSGFEVGGVDYSAELIDIARKAMPDRSDCFNAMEASACPVDPTSDIVIANHVIHYFPSHEYTSAVVNLMLRKALRVVSISGVPNADLKEQSEKERRGLLTPEEYEKKYAGLDILYYGKGWFEEIASRHGFHVRFFDHEMPGFAQNPFRYDCVMTKTDLKICRLSK